MSFFSVMLTAIQYIADDLTGNFNGDDFDIEVSPSSLHSQIFCADLRRTVCSL